MQRLEKINNSLLQICPNLHSNRPLYEIIKLDPKYKENEICNRKPDPHPNRMVVAPPYEIQ